MEFEFGQNKFGKRIVCELQARIIHVNKFMKSLANFLHQRLSLMYVAIPCHGGISVSSM